MPSCRPSPVIAQAGWIYQPLNEVAWAFDVLDVDVDDVVDEAWCGDVELDVDEDVCGGGVLEQFDDTSVLLLSRLFNRESIGLWPVVILADTGNVDDDFIICGGITENDSSCKPSNFSNSFGSLAPGKSCLLANIKIGTPCKQSIRKSLKYASSRMGMQHKFQYDERLTWFSEHFAVRISSILASSMRSTSTESTTNTIPSVHLKEEIAPN